MSRAMESWFRVTARDGSTVAYTPDVVTARIIAQDLTIREWPTVGGFPLEVEYPNGTREPFGPTATTPNEGAPT